MSRLSAIVRRLYGDEVGPAATKVVKPRGRLRRRLEDMSDALGRRPTVLWVVRIVVILLTLFVVIEGIFQYNRLQAWSTTVLARRADVDRELKRRENLIPGVVALASRYADYERGMFKYISDARGVLQAIKDSQASGTNVSNLLDKALTKLVALAEAYPDLKATQPVQDLIAKLADTEDRIADAKKDYNAAAEQFNQYMTTFPGNVFAFFYRFKTAEYISLEENLDVPQINLDVSQINLDVSQINLDESKQKPADVQENVNLDGEVEDPNKSKGAEQ
jgi:LemA protein